MKSCQIEYYHINVSKLTYENKKLAYNRKNCDTCSDVSLPALLLLLNLRALTFYFRALSLVYSILLLQFRFLFSKKIKKPKKQCFSRKKTCFFQRKKNIFYANPASHQNFSWKNGKKCNAARVSEQSRLSRPITCYRNNCKLQEVNQEHWDLFTSDVFPKIFHYPNLWVLQNSKHRVSQQANFEILCLLLHQMIFLPGKRTPLRDNEVPQFPILKRVIKFSVKTSFCEPPVFVFLEQQAGNGPSWRHI